MGFRKFGDLFANRLLIGSCVDCRLNTSNQRLNDGLISSETMMMK